MRLAKILPSGAPMVVGIGGREHSFRKQKNIFLEHQSPEEHVLIGDNRGEGQFTLGHMNAQGPPADSWAPAGPQVQDDGGPDEAWLTAAVAQATKP